MKHYNYFVRYSCIIIFLTLYGAILPSNSTTKKSAVSYVFNGGRFGDNLASYTKAKWVSYIYNIPLIYKPFPGSDSLVLHETDATFNQAILSSFKGQQILRDISEVDPSANILYLSTWTTKMNLNLEDTVFMKKIKHLIALKNPLENIIIDKKRVSIALHVRTGGDYNSDILIKPKQPLRFPPCSFYTDQIKKIGELTNLPLFVYIFTDDSYPENIATKFKKDLNDIDVIFSYRTKGNNYKDNAIEDFFEMLRFDCLIRPRSHYSIWAHRLGNYKIVIYPTNAKKVNNGWIIDEIAVENKFHFSDHNIKNEITLESEDFQIKYIAACYECGL